MGASAAPVTPSEKRRRQQAKNSQLPLLASSCPGWICYAEKTHGKELIPHISTVKSPQAIMGSIVKRYFADRILGQKDSEIYHVTVMPCYDKKLEASRDDFTLPSGVREVDMVLTTSELKEIIEQYKIDFPSLQPTTVDPMLNEILYSEHGDIKIGGISGGSGGYLETLFRYAAHELFGVTVNEIQYKKGRNDDFRDCVLEVEGKKVLRFAMCYGFRNIQNIVRKLKQKTCEYDFVEVMASPSGCLNGGGQIRSASRATAKELLNAVGIMYHKAAKTSVIPPEDKHSFHSIVYRDWLGCEPYSENAKALLHTSYHAREQIAINPLTIHW